MSTEDDYDFLLTKRVRQLFPDCEVEQWNADEDWTACFKLRFVYKRQLGVILVHVSRQMTLDEAARCLSRGIKDEMAEMIQEFPAAFTSLEGSCDVVY